MHWPSHVELTSILEFDTQRERRSTFKLVSYWDKIRQQHALPAENDIDPDADEVAESWDHCFLVQLRDFCQHDFNYTYLGTAIVQAYQGVLSPNEPAELAAPNANKLMPSYKQVIQARRPLMEQGSFTNLRNKQVKYRQCMLPLGKDGVIDSIFGQMRFRIEGETA